MIGFTLITYEKECDYDDTPGYEIYRLMIAKDYQGKGFGKEAIKRIIIYAAWHPDNKVSERLCLDNGFEVVGKDKDDGAIRSRLQVNG